jgi:hypothetical protein
MALDTVAILDRVVSHALAAGYFERVNQHEPKTAPGTDCTPPCGWTRSNRPAASPD